MTAYSCRLAKPGCGVITTHIMRCVDCRVPQIAHFYCCGARSGAQCMQDISSWQGHQQCTAARQFGCQNRCSPVVQPLTPELLQVRLQQQQVLHGLLQLGLWRQAAVLHDKLGGTGNGHLPRSAALQCCPCTAPASKPTKSCQAKRCEVAWVTCLAPWLVISMCCNGVGMAFPAVVVVALSVQVVTTPCWPRFCDILCGLLKAETEMVHHAQDVASTYSTIECLAAHATGTAHPELKFSASYTSRRPVLSRAS